MKKLTVNLEDDVHHIFNCVCMLEKKTMSQVIREQIEIAVKNSGDFLKAGGKADFTEYYSRFENLL